MQFGYLGSSHDKAVDALFGAAVITDTPANSLKCVLMAFVNRSGSNLVADALKTTGRFAGFEEILNDSTIRTLAKRYGSRTFEEYLTRVHDEQVAVPGQIWGLKAGAAQLAMLFRTKAIPRLLRPTVVYVRRRDIIGQAISLFIAEQNARWTTLDEGRNAEVLYDGPRILAHFRSISTSYSLLDQVLTISGLPCFTIFYEEFLDRPNELVSRLGVSLSGEGLLPRLEALTLKQQRDDRNYDFRKRFAADLQDVEFVTQ
ncbi:MAG TPA: Stf0 family sulfotransferase [Caulobacteraceae bacterium]|nr:Stf0 family sulfotransferase [Caulobacteraceae bacterium]